MCDLSCFHPHPYPFAHRHCSKLAWRTLTVADTHSMRPTKIFLLISLPFQPTVTYFCSFLGVTCLLGAEQLVYTIKSQSRLTWHKEICLRQPPRQAVSSSRPPRPQSSTLPRTWHTLGDCLLKSLFLLISYFAPGPWLH
jgi:hypothetical protein